ncbi:Pup-like protein [Actinokineospora alba]|uniref:Prokaryotic ubiquitin-like protein Pup n=1 Tax=Actinokineospora alba TaxID=504798 RepID=A0A1H0L940_9PSEU|nr:ubiquitin-like protein Pup [Actinokineospora alba]TDP67235.1 Pup-like protein [Actinokineospora alba]SDJ03334.1 Pup-like protein [Actinokineospora alba]SDO64523.1 Pup-like protein [Actinokineospora alba]
MSQHQAHHQRDDDESELELASEAGAASRAEKEDELDALIEDIDSILENTVIVEQYVQKGGQ